MSAVVHFKRGPAILISAYSVLGSKNSEMSFPIKVKRKMSNFISILAYWLLASGILQSALAFTEGMVTHFLLSIIHVARLYFSTFFCRTLLSEVGRVAHCFLA